MSLLTPLSALDSDVVSPPISTVKPLILAIVHHILPSEPCPQTLHIRRRLLTDPRIIEILLTLLGLAEVVDPGVSPEHPVLEDVELIHFDQVEPTVLRDHVLPVGRSPVLMMSLTIIGRIVREL